MIDVVIAGAGPAGCVAAFVLARAGVRVLLLDRARFPRAKFCGDSLNPGAVALLRRLPFGAFPERRALAADGIMVSGEDGVKVHARYPAGVRGRLVSRTDLDTWLLEQALAAGVRFEDGVRVVAPVVASGPRGRVVTGMRVAHGTGGERVVGAPLTIAADGRRSRLAFHLGLARHPGAPRRWAIGRYFEGVHDLSSFGEMHIRAGRYIGVAPLPGGVANACLVTEDLGQLRGRGDIGAVLAAHLAGDPVLGPRFASARPVTRAVAVGPLAVDASAAGMPGLLLAGDAAGFIDPMTGDGMYFAMRGGELAAHAALQALSGGEGAPHRWLEARRRRDFGFKRRFDRMLRFVVSQPHGVAIGSRLARLYPASIRRLVAVAGDVGLAKDHYT